MNGPHDDARDPQTWFHDRATAYVEAQMLFHLGRTGVMAALVEGPATTAELAGRLGLVEQPLEACLDYVSGVDDLVEKDGDRWALTDFGRAVAKRFGRETPDGLRLNLFDVRVGAYGPVWGGLGQLLRGEATYGDGVLRAGGEAAEGLYTVCARMAPGFRATIAELDVQQAVEIGVTTGLLEKLSGMDLDLYGLDRSPEALAIAEARRAASGTDPVTWLEADLFDLSWTERLDRTRPGVVFSVHFHEIMAAGRDRVIAFLRDLGHALPGWCVVAAEQPRLPPGDRVHRRRSEWLYAQSNVLIHHLIGNGRILTDGSWRALFVDSGLEQVTIKEMNFLGYRTYPYRLPAA